MADPAEKPAVPAPYVPPSQIAPEELMKAFQEDGIVPVPPAAETPKVAAPAAVPPSPQKADEVPALVRIAKERDAFRKEMESAKPHMEALKVFAPQELTRLAAARAAGDPQAALAALGFTHSQYNAKVAGAPLEETPVAEKTSDPEITTIKQELAALKGERDNLRLQESRKEALGKMEGLLKDNPKFNSINSLKDYEGIERVILQYWTENGNTLPAETFEESVLLAAELLEGRYKNGDIPLTKKQWELLTAAPASAPVAAKAPEAPRPGSGSDAPRTLTNAMTTAPAAARTAPKSREELLERIAKGDDLSGFDP